MNIKEFDHVRIMDDAYPELVGTEGAVLAFGTDGTTAWVGTGPLRGVWCSVANLEKVD